MKTHDSTRSLPFARTKLSLVLAQLALLAIPGLVHANAETEDATALGVVTITAERREASLQQTPISAGVISNDELEKTGFNHLFDIEKNVAGVTFYKGAANQQSNIIIRGIGTLNMGYTSAVGVYVDDVPLARAGAAGQWNLPDIERIEVLRGPQGTLYGQNSTAGAVRLISIDPGDERNAWISAGIGNYSTFETRGYLAGPLKEGVLAASLAFSHRQNDGFGKNHTSGKSVYATDATQARAKLRFTPNEDFEAVLALDTLLDKSDNGTKSPINHPDGNKPRDTWSLVDLDGRLERHGASLRLTQALNDQHSLRSITSFRGWTHDPSRMEHGGLPRVSNDADQRWRQRVFFQEFQLTGELSERLSYTSGVLFNREYFHNYNIVKNSADGINIARRLAITQFDTDDIALYGQFDYRFTDRWTLTAGVRYWQTEQEYTASAYTLNENLERTLERFAVDGLKKKSDGITPRLTLGYQWTPDVFVYGSYTQGAKFGGHNRSAATNTVVHLSAEPEEVTAYELGVKSTAFNNRLQINAAFFYNTYEDYLANVSNPIIDGVQYNGSVLTNAAKAVTYGSELEVRARLTQALDWNLSAAWLHSEFQDFVTPTEDFTDNELPYAPKLTAATGLSYTTWFNNGDSLRLHGSIQYISKQQSDYQNTPIAEVASRSNVDVGADYWFADGHWSASLKVRNLQDKDHVLQKTYTPLYGIDTNAYDAPRTLLASVRYDF